MLQHRFVAAEIINSLMFVQQESTSDTVKETLDDSSLETRRLLLMNIIVHWFVSVMKA